MVVSTTNGASYVEFGSHHHKLTCDVLGKVTLGDVVVGSNENSFNMADTAFYKEHVSASLTGKFDQAAMNITVDSLNEYGSVVLTKTYMNPYQPKGIALDITAKNDHYEIIPKPIAYTGSFFKDPMGNDFTKKTTDDTVYENGVKSVTVPQSNISLSKNYVQGRLYSVTVTAKASNGNSGQRTIVL